MRVLYIGGFRTLMVFGKPERLYAEVWFLTHMPPAECE